MLQNWIINLGKPNFKYELYQMWGKYALKNRIFKEGALQLTPNLLSGKIGNPSCENPNEAPAKLILSSLSFRKYGLFYDLNVPLGVALFRKLHFDYETLF